ncbi:hypothetical protein QAD02_015042 [Eretmocerus hayati]|uniref:Uncharacterized protein n=1 Tax=Eretmocerus hayati TaxID=131215 RepID=A0ACC2P6N5_9HYME|nr:hypothetical protein QAD02_015042 [Eretmocerus hayati]
MQLVMTVYMLLLVCYGTAQLPIFQTNQYRDGAANELTWMENRLSMNLTPLGHWLLSPEGTIPPPKISNRTKPFLILVWKHGPYLERRHLRRFSQNKIFSPWDSCSVNNCRLSYDPRLLISADAVLFHLHRLTSKNELPQLQHRPVNQRWIFLTDESPINTFVAATMRRGLTRSKLKLSEFDGLFNWSMSYRMDSDVPVPYGRTVLRSSNIVERGNESDEEIVLKRGMIPFADRGLVAVLGSNCGGANGRWGYIERLKGVLGDDLQILGRCLSGNRTACPGHFDSDCSALKGAFKFYLAFENSNCREYLSEKLWWQAYAKSSVPVIMGAPKSDCLRLLPPNSYLHVDDYHSPEHLANRLILLGKNRKKYERLQLGWRKRYKILNEHGYFGSPSAHYCRLCQALNYNSNETKIYWDLEEFWSAERDCRFYKPYA